MLRRFIKLVTFLSCGVTAMTGFIGCVDEKYDIPQSGGDADLILEIGALKTRALFSGSEFTSAEKFVKTVDLFFYPSDAGDDTQATYYVRSGVTMNSDPSTSNEGKIRVSITPEDIVAIFGSNTTCRVYAAVNTKETENKQKITLRDLKNLKTTVSGWVITDYLDENGDLSDFEGFAMFTVNPEGDEVKLETIDGEDKISGKVIVDKLMSKIDLFLGFGPSGSETNIDEWSVTAVNPNDPASEAKIWKVYRPSDAEKQKGDESVFGDEAEVYIVNGVRAVRLGGAFDGDKFLTTLSEEDYFDLWAEDMENANNDFMNFAHGFKDNGLTDSKGKYPYVVESSFYTYPNSWTEGVLNTDTYLILKVNWIPVDDDSANVKDNLLETYYKVPLNKNESVDQNRILSNKHYSVKVKINTLGGLHFGEPLLLDDCSYEVIPWNRMSLDAKLRETRYLEVRQQVEDRDGAKYTAIMNNTERIEIPFYSSHKVEIRSATISYNFFYNSTAEGSDDNLVVKPMVRMAKFGTAPATEDKYVTVVNGSGDTADAFTLNREQLDAVDTDGKPLYAGIFIDEINSRIIIQHDFHAIEKNGTHYTHIKNDRNSGVNKIHKEPYSPYDITIELKHKDWMDTDTNGEDFQLDKITVRQYPSRYIEVTYNPGGKNERAWWDLSSSATRKYGHTLINGSRENFSGIEGIRTGWFNSWTGGILGYLENPMMYIINVTTLGLDDVVDEPLHIGDPRMIYIDNNLETKQELTGEKGGAGTPHYSYEPLKPRTADDAEDTSWSTSAYVWVNNVSSNPNERHLKYYYPTNETPLEEYKYMISPQFRIASAYSMADGRAFGRVNARRRCASYQEDRYPAGRWRLPTPGELLFMIRLSTDNVIPPLFGTNDKAYWTSHGAYIINGKTITERKNAGSLLAGIFGSDDDAVREGGHYVVSGAVRCVYDEWYWKDKDGEPDRLNYPLPDTDVFYWGDKEKNNPQAQPDPEPATDVEP